MTRSEASGSARYDEGRLSLRLNHPNVVQTYEVLVSEGELAIAMEYLAEP